MGIPHYFHVITQTTPGIVRSSLPADCGRLYLDFNGAIHPASQAAIRAANERVQGGAAAPADIEKDILASVWAYFKKIVDVAQPTERIDICIDGVAPCAKMLQQRKRRYLSLLRREMLAASPSASAAGAAAVVWDSNAITPGTPFMKRLHASLRAYLRHFKDRPTTLHTADEPGEGEHKIFRLMANEPKDDDRTHVIYGLDADLIMLSLLQHRPHIYLLREVVHMKGVLKDTDGHEDAYVYLDIDALRKGILTQIYKRHGWEIPPVSPPADNLYSPEINNVIDAYVSVCFFLGNDFLPHLTTLSLKKNGHDKLLKSAAAVWNAQGSWVDADGDLNLNRMGKILEAFADGEDEVLRELVEEYAKTRVYARGSEERVDMYPLLEENKDPLARIILEAPIAQWRPLYYKHLFLTRASDHRTVMGACDSYWNGMLWTWAYYKRQPRAYDSAAARWLYPYGYAPSIRDLVNHLVEFDAQQALKGAKTTQWVNPVVQLLAVLPRQSSALLPPAALRLMDDPAYGCSYLFPKSYALQTFLKGRLWECTPVLPAFNIEALESQAAAEKA